jgi:hypothetical protein
LNDVTDMVWRFPDQQSRDAVGRAVRKQGFDCYGTGPTAIDKACLLTVEESTGDRRLAVAQLVRRMAHRLIVRPVLGPPALKP